MCCIATNIERLVLFCNRRCLSRTYVVRLEEKPLRRRNSWGCSGWAEDVILVSHLKCRKRCLSVGEVTIFGTGLWFEPELPPRLSNLYSLHHVFLWTCQLMLLHLASWTLRFLKKNFFFKCTVAFSLIKQTFWCCMIFRAGAAVFAHFLVQRAGYCSLFLVTAR